MAAKDSAEQNNTEISTDNSQKLGKNEAYTPEKIREEYAEKIEEVLLTDSKVEENIHSLTEKQREALKEEKDILQKLEVLEKFGDHLEEVYQKIIDQHTEKEKEVHKSLSMFLGLQNSIYLEINNLIKTEDVDNEEILRARKQLKEKIKILNALYTSLEKRKQGKDWKHYQEKFKSMTAPQIEKFIHEKL